MLFEQHCSFRKIVRICFWTGVGSMFEVVLFSAKLSIVIAILRSTLSICSLYQAQRKFASNQSPPATPRHINQQLASPLHLKETPKTEDFLRFLCLRGTCVYSVRHDSTHSTCFVTEECLSNYYYPIIIIR